MRQGEKTVGIIGGMGPEATVEFMRRVIAATPARDDRDHLHMLVDNNPKIPSRIAAIIEGTGEDPAPVLCGQAPAGWSVSRTDDDESTQSSPAQYTCTSAIPSA